MKNLIKAYTSFGLTEDNLSIAFRYTNLICSGKETIPLDVEVTDEHKKIHHKVRAHRRLILQLKVLPDGNFQIMKIDGKKLNDEIIV